MQRVRSVACTSIQASLLGLWRVAWRQNHVCSNAILCLLIFCSNRMCSTPCAGLRFLPQNAGENACSQNAQFCGGKQPNVLDSSVLWTTTSPTTTAPATTAHLLPMPPQQFEQRRHGEKTLSTGTGINFSYTKLKAPFSFSRLSCTGRQDEDEMRRLILTTSAVDFAASRRHHREREQRSTTRRGMKME